MAEMALRNVCKQFDSAHYGVKNFNLDIHDKEFVIFVGPSGCGKSTTLRLIAGLEEITDGELWIDGKLCNYLEPRERDISMVFQNYALYPNMTVYENIAYSLKIRKVPKKEIDKRVKEVAKILEIEPLLKRKPVALSGGQKQRVAIGAAIIRKPKAFLMDEPLSNLDAKLRAQMRVELKKIHNQLDTTIIYVTHDQTEAMTLGTRIVVLKDGVIMQVDSPIKLYNEPNNLFVAGFIGSPQMNFVDAKCKIEGGNAVLSFDKFKITLPAEKSKKLSAYNGKNVLFGIRPDDMSDSPRDMEDYKDCIIEANVSGYELLGSEVILYFNIAGVNMCAKVDSATKARFGDHVRLAINPNKVHVFDKETELTITN